MLVCLSFLRKFIFCFQAMGMIHAIESDGTIVTDVEVFTLTFFLELGEATPPPPNPTPNMSGAPRKFMKENIQLVHAHTPTKRQHPGYPPET
jgi:hypothetical protein